MSKYNEVLASQAALITLEQASEFAEAMLDNLPTIHLIIDGDGEIIRANKIFCSTFSCNIDEATRSNILDYFSVANKDVFKYQIGQLEHKADGQRYIKFLLDANSADGKKSIPFQWNLSDFETITNNRCKYISVIGEDLSSIYEYEAKLSQLFSGLPAGILLINTKGCVEEVMSDNANVLLNRSNLKGVSISDCFRDYDLNNGLSSEESYGILENLDRIDPEEFNRWRKLLPATLKVEADESRWIKISYHPIVEGNSISKLMIFMEDHTDSHNSSKQKKQIESLEKKSKVLYEKAIKDPLSGLYNRLYMQDGTMSLFANFQRQNIAHLAIIILDIDHFKMINDTHGHRTGDDVIARVGSIISHSIRKSDVAIRYGGEEFLVLNSNKEDKEGGLTVCAERIRKAVENANFESHTSLENINITISAGVAICRRGEPIEDTIARADKLLYEAKNTGRNKVVSEIDNNPGEAE